MTVADLLAAYEIIGLTVTVADAGHLHVRGPLILRVAARTKILHRKAEILAHLRRVQDEDAGEQPS